MGYGINAELGIYVDWINMAINVIILKKTIYKQCIEYFTYMMLLFLFLLSCSSFPAIASKG